MLQVNLYQDEETGRKYYGPILCCDLCKKQITDLNLALYKWQNDERRNPVHGTFCVLHKGKCDEVHNQTYNAERWPWNEATTLLALLINNSQGKSEKSQDLWPHLVEHYCPDEQLEGVQQVAGRILKDPVNRPPSVNDLAV